MRGLMALLQRSDMTEDGMHEMETIGHFPGRCEELFGLQGHDKSEHVGTFFRSGWEKRHGYFPDQS